MAQAQAGSNFLALPVDIRWRLLALLPTAGSWSRHEVAEGTIPDNGYDNMHAASISIG